MDNEWIGISEFIPKVGTMYSFLFKAEARVKTRLLNYLLSYKFKSNSLIKGAWEQSIKALDGMPRCTSILKMRIKNVCTLLSRIQFFIL